MEAQADNRINGIPAPARDIVSTVRKIRTSTPGSKHSKLSDRTHLLGLLTKEGLPHLFVTFNPSNPQSILIYNTINRSKVQQPFTRILEQLRIYRRFLRGTLYK